MRFLLDESADFPLFYTLEALGHDVKSIIRDFTLSIPDTEVLAIAVQEERVLITNDRDFGELIFRRGLPHAGVVLFRLGDEELDIKAAWLRRVLTLSPRELRSFVVVTDRAIRIRRSPHD